MKLSAIARELGEKISLKKTSERLSRHLQAQEMDQAIDETLAEIESGSRVEGRVASGECQGFGVGVGIGVERSETGFGNEYECEYEYRNGPARETSAGLPVAIPASKSKSGSGLDFDADPDSDFDTSTGTDGNRGSRRHLPSPLSPRRRLPFPP